MGVALKPWYVNSPSSVGMNPAISRGQPVPRGPADRGPGRRCADNASEALVVDRLAAAAQPPLVDKVIVQAGHGAQQLPPAVEIMIQRCRCVRSTVGIVRSGATVRTCAGLELPAPPQHGQRQHLGSARGAPVSADAGSAPDGRQWHARAPRRRRRPAGRHRRESRGSNPLARAPP